MADDSPLRERTLRDAWEHFDEKLDVYMLQNNAGVFFPSPNLNSHTLADDPTGNIFKLLDVEAECLVLMGQKFFYYSVRDEVKIIFTHSEQ